MVKEKKKKITLLTYIWKVRTRSLWGGLVSEECKISLKSCQLTLGLGLRRRTKKLTEREREREREREEEEEEEEETQVENEKPCGLWSWGAEEKKEADEEREGWSREKDLCSLIIYYYYFFLLPKFL